MAGFWGQPSDEDEDEDGEVERCEVECARCFRRRWCRGGCFSFADYSRSRNLLRF